MEHLVRAGLLYDFYGGLLTDKQRQVLELYYWEDWSLAEIAASSNVSRQAIHDLIQRSEHLLEEYESKLGLLKRFVEQENILKRALENLKNLTTVFPANDLNNQRLTETIKDLEHLLEAD